MTFRTTIAQTGNNTGILVPDEIVTARGAGKQPKVRVTLNDHTYRSSIASMGGRFLISLSADNRAKAGAATATAFAALSDSHQRRYVLAIDGAKAAETRQRRIAKTIAELASEGSSAPSGG